MPATYEIAPDGSHILVQFNGEARSDFIATMFEKLLADPRFSPDMPHLVDLTGADFPVTVDFAGMLTTFNMFARAYEGMGATMRCATYAPSKLHFGMARMFQNLSESSDAIVAAVFDDLDAARACVREGRCRLIRPRAGQTGNPDWPSREPCNCHAGCGYVTGA